MEVSLLLQTEQFKLPLQQLVEWQHTSVTQDLIWLVRPLAHASRQMVSQQSGLVLLLNAIVSPFCQFRIEYIKQFLIPIAVDCGPLKAPYGGSVSGSSTTFGSTATYACNYGFTLVGVSRVQCQANGQWSGPTPSCQGE